MTPHIRREEITRFPGLLDVSFMVRLISCLKSAWFLCLIFFIAVSPKSPAGPVSWGKVVLINTVSNFVDGGRDARGINPGTFGSQYGRMTRLADGSWLVVYTIYDNKGYNYGDAHGLSWQGTALQIARSTDNCRSWTIISTLRGDNRDLDNGEIIQLPDGQLRMAARSVRWQQSYRICVWSSNDGGVTWKWLSQPDENEGLPGSLGHPDKGVYEPDFCLLKDGTLALFYSSEKHVTENPSYSQIVSEKLSTDGGQTWGHEIWVAWDPRRPSDRPGMPVITKMADGRYLVVFEVVGSHRANVFCKTSRDGKTWSSGVGTPIPGQTGGPYVVSLASGRLAVTSNTGNVSFSDDFGASWRLNDPPAWGNGTIKTYWWLSVYQTGPEEIGVIASVPRASGGTDVRIKFGTFSPLTSKN